MFLLEPWLWFIFPLKHAWLAMVNVFVKMHLTLHVPFGTLVMVYVPFEMHLALTIVNFFIKMHLTHNNILNVSSKTQT
jgi:hypothetical protein